MWHKFPPSAQSTSALGLGLNGLCVGAFGVHDCAAGAGTQPQMRSYRHAAAGAQPQVRSHRRQNQSPEFIEASARHRAIARLLMRCGSPEAQTRDAALLLSSGSRAALQKPARGAALPRPGSCCCALAVVRCCRSNGAAPCCCALAGARSVLCRSKRTAPCIRPCLLMAWWWPHRLPKSLAG
jgi:hypothetical protein